MLKQSVNQFEAIHNTRSVDARRFANFLLTQNTQLHGGGLFTKSSIEIFLPEKMRTLVEDSLDPRTTHPLPLSFLDHELNRTMKRYGKINKQTHDKLQRLIYRVKDKIEDVKEEDADDYTKYPVKDHARLLKIYYDDKKRIHDQKNKTTYPEEVSEDEYSE